MPKKHIPHKSFMADITINDYANSKYPSDRLKKHNLLMGNRLNCNIKDEHIVNDIDDDGELHQLINKKKTKKPIQTTDDKGIDYMYYPIDIWYQIANYIRPEDVCRFALICQQTAIVCSTSSFWINLYKRHYQPADNIPNYLERDGIQRIGGLRSRVIRILFYVYKPFVERLPTLATQDYRNLLKRECVTNWCTKIKENWIFCYKFRQKFIKGSRLEMSERLRKSKRIVDIMRDHYQNPEEGCKILMIKTSSFCPLIGHDFGQALYLGSINQALAQGFINYKLQLSFVNQCNEHIVSISYNPVLQIQALDWWMPAYYSYLE